MGDKVVIDTSELARLRAIEVKYQALVSSLESSHSDENGTMLTNSGLVKVQKSPQDGWKPREKQSSPFSHEAVEFDPENMEGLYQFLISAVTPRPIALVSTFSKSGIANLAPYSYFGAMGHSPPMVAIGFCDNHNKENKDSLQNLLDNNNEFVVNIIGEWMVESANFSCGPFPPEVDEFEVSGLTKAKCLKVNAPRVAESACSMECIAQEVKRYGSSSIVLARIVQFHVQPEVLDSTKQTPVINFDRYKPVSRLGGVSYGLTGQYFDIPRPGRDDWK